jgi:hypothetical protein
MKTLLLVCLPVFCISLAHAGKLKESDYQKAWAAEHGGKVEVRMPDGTRCDIETKTHAIEVEFASKWCEGVGQALWYSFQTNKKAGIVLILRSEKDRKHLMRLRSLIAGKKLDIKVWVIEPK